MVWKRVGKIFEPPSEIGWMHSHASYPCVKELAPDTYAISFSSRDKTNKSSIGFMVVSLFPKPRVLELKTSPILVPGEKGFFDDSGTTPGCIITVGTQHYLYYLGWNLAVTVPFRNAIGLAISSDGKTFQKFSAAPIMDRSSEDPLTLSYPTVLRDNDEFRMWYGTTRTWSYGNHEMLHVITSARSENGINWHRSGINCIEPQNSEEYAFSRPSVIREGASYKMWFCFRGKYYKIGYAESKDGSCWERKDSQFGLDRSDEAWESEMVGYPSVVSTASGYVMFYNGNNFGKSGIGAAVWE